eukprot:359188-Chlamydomonas_euryale.AAC.21
MYRAGVPQPAHSASCAGRDAPLSACAAGAVRLYGAARAARPWRHEATAAAGGPPGRGSTADQGTGAVGRVGGGHGAAARGSAAAAAGAARRRAHRGDARVCRSRQR